MACCCSSFRDAWLSEARMLDLTPSLCGGLMLRSLTEAARYVRWRSILKAAAAMGGLRRLSLAGCKLSSNESVLVAETLIENPGLRFLDLQGNDLAGRGCRTLGLAMGFHSGLCVLDLSGNSVGSEGATSLARALRNSEGWGTSLRSLHLDHNHIRLQGIVLLAAALSENTTLQHLSLASNHIQAEGAVYLAEALRQNTSLLTLNLSSNFLFKEGALEMGDMLACNHTLQELNLVKNYINDEGYEALRAGLRNNPTLMRLHLAGNYISTALRETATGDIIFEDGLNDDAGMTSPQIPMSAAWSDDDSAGVDAAEEGDRVDAAEYARFDSLSLVWNASDVHGAAEGDEDVTPHPPPRLNALGGSTPTLVWRDAPAGANEVDEVHDVVWTPPPLGSHSDI